MADRRPAPPEKSVIEKLRLKSGSRAVVQGGPTGYLRQFPTNMHIDEEVGSDAAEYDFIQVFASRKADLVALAPVILAAAKPSATIWVSYPKGKSMATDLNRDIVRATLQPLGLDTIAQIAIDNTWSALRVKPISRSSAEKST
jgi:hypothetical protein